MKKAHNSYEDMQINLENLKNYKEIARLTRDDFFQFIDYPNNVDKLYVLYKKTLFDVLRSQKEPLLKCISFIFNMHYLADFFAEKYREEIPEKNHPIHDKNLYFRARNTLTRLCFSFFFKNDKHPELEPLYKSLTTDEFYMLLPTIITTIEFTSIIKDSFVDAIEYHNKKQKTPLDRRVYLSSMMNTADDAVEKFMNALPKDTIATHKVYESNLIKFFKNDLHRLKIAHGRVYSIIRSYLFDNNLTDADTLEVYRAYKISENEDVILKRKERVQSSNTSISYAPSYDFCINFAKYSDDASNEFDINDRLFFVEKFYDVEHIRNRYKEKNTKNVVCKYHIPMKNVVTAYTSHLNHELEYLILPESDNRLTRYQFVQ